jgi:neopullulanase
MEIPCSFFQLKPIKMKYFSAILFLFCINSLHAQTIEHLEPSNWWIGMKNSKVQVLVHGKNIASLTASIQYKGVKIAQSHRTENPNYLFLDLIINPNTKAGKFPIVFSENKTKKTECNFELKNRQPNASQRASFANADVIYLITPDRFANGDISNDSQPNTIEKANRADKDGRHGGDIKGIENQLDYIKNMGFTSIWPMPLLTNNQPNTTYHGYAITDFYQIDPRFGTNESYAALTQKAHQKGLKMIMDVVLNHCGREHWWMRDLPSKDWINYAGKYSPTNHQRQTIQDIHASKYDAEKHTQGWFVPSMPDLNQRNEFMANYLIQNAIWWIEYANLDGLRIDTYPYSDKNFSANWGKAILAEYPNLNMVGEEWSYKPAVVSYWQKGKKNHDGYQSNLPALMDFPGQNALEQSLKDTNFASNSFMKIYEALAEDFLYAKPNNLVVFADNHDMNRFFTQIKEDVALFKMGLAYVLTTRGVPQIYYGTEIGMTNPKSDAHGEIRSDFPGGWQNDAQNAFTQTNLTPQQRDLQDFTKKILNWRLSASAIHNGKLIQFAPEEGIYSYFRSNETEKYWIIFNTNNTEKSVESLKFEEQLTANYRLKDVLSAAIIEVNQTIKIEGKGFRIFKVE